MTDNEIYEKLKELANSNEHDWIKFISDVERHNRYWGRNDRRENEPIFVRLQNQWMRIRKLSWRTGELRPLDRAKLLAAMSYHIQDEDEEWFENALQQGLNYIEKKHE